MTLMKPTPEALEQRAAKLRGERQTRTFAVSGLELRDDGADSVGFSGYASVTDSPYVIQDFLGEFTEIVARGAFTKTLQERADVRLLINHDGIPLARTRSGTLTLSENETGLLSEASLDARSPLVQTLRSAMERRDLDEMSFAFQAVRDEWNEDYTERRILEVRLFDVSIVTYPANPATSASLRFADAIRTLAGAEAEQVLAEVRSMSSALTPETITRAAELILKIRGSEPDAPAGDMPVSMEKLNRALRDSYLI